MQRCNKLIIIISIIIFSVVIGIQYKTINAYEIENKNSKIIRDADKIDIYYSLTIYSKEAVWESKDLSNDIISDEIYREFKEDKRMNYKNRRSAADGLVCHFAYVYDFYYKYSLQIKLVHRFENNMK